MKKKDFLKIWIISMVCMLISVGVKAQMTAMLPSGLNVRAEVDRVANQAYETDVDDVTRNGDIKQNMHANLNMNYTFVLHPAIRIGAGVRYDYLNETLDDVPVSGMEWGREHHTLRPMANIMLLGKIKNTPLMIYGHFGMDKSEWAFERFSGIVAGAAILKASREEMLAVGMIGIFNRTSRIPCFPVAMYRRVYNKNWTLNLMYPFLGMQYNVSPKQSIAAGFTVVSHNYWLKPEVDGMPEKVLFSRSLLRTGLNYDWDVAPAVRLTAQAGWEYTMRGTIFSADGRHRLYEMNHPSGLYAHLGVSYSPSRAKAKQMLNQRK